MAKKKTEKLKIIKKTVKLKDIIPYENNSKLHTDEQKEILVKSLKENNYLSPFILDKNNVIISGHGRRIAMKELYSDDTEIEVIDGSHLTKKQVKQYRILDNKSTEMTGHDSEKLARELDEIYSNGEYDIDKIFKDTGIDSETISNDLSKYLKNGGVFLDGEKDENVEDYSELDKQMDDLNGMDTFKITLEIPSKHKKKVLKFLSNGEKETSRGLGRGVLKSCGLL